MKYLLLLLLLSCNQREILPEEKSVRSDKIYVFADSGQMTCKFMTQNGSKSKRYVSLINLYTIGLPLLPIDTIGYDMTSLDTLLMYDFHYDTLPMALYQIATSHLFTDMNGNLFASYLTPPTILQ